MAIQHIIEKLSGASQSLSLPIFIYDDGTPPAAIDQDDVAAYLVTQYGVTIPSDVLGVPDDGDPGFKRLSRSAWRVTIKYRVQTLRPLHPVGVGEAARSSFNFQLPRKYVRWGTEIAKYPGSAPTWHGLVNVVQDCNSLACHSGIWLEPPPVSFSTSISVSPSTVTGSWVRTLAGVIQAGMVNSVSMGSGAYAAGELLIVHAHGQSVSANAFNIDIGWGWAQNVSGETRDGITGIAYDGHDFVWEWTKPLVDRSNNQLGLQVAAVYVNRVRPRGDLTAIGISPP